MLRKFVFLLLFNALQPCGAFSIDNHHSEKKHTIKTTFIFDEEFGSFADTVTIDDTKYKIERSKTYGSCQEGESNGLACLYVNGYAFIESDFLKACLGEQKKHILELGFGKGDLLKKIQVLAKENNLKLHYDGVDYSFDNNEVAKKHLLHSNSLLKETLTFAGVGPYLRTQISKNESYDLVAGFHFLHCLGPKDFFNTLIYLSALVKENGKLFLTLHSTGLETIEIAQQKSYVEKSYKEAFEENDPLLFWKDEKLMRVDPYSLTKILDLFGFHVEKTGYYEQFITYEELNKTSDGQQVSLLTYVGVVAMRTKKEMDVNAIKKILEAIKSKR